MSVIDAAPENAVPDNAAPAGTAPAGTAPDYAVLDYTVLDNPAWSALTGAHAHLAEGNDLARRYPADVSPFAAVRSWDDPGVWDAVIELVGYDAEFPGPPESVALPPGWVRGEPFQGVQLVETERLHGRPDDEAVLLGAADVPEMLDLVARAQPGPFLPRTYQLGRYVGIRRDGRLAAMAGERLQPAGWTEISGRNRRAVPRAGPGHAPRAGRRPPHPRARRARHDARRGEQHPRDRALREAGLRGAPARGVRLGTHAGQACERPGQWLTGSSFS